MNVILHEFLKVKGKVRSLNDVNGPHDIQVQLSRYTKISVTNSILTMKLIFRT